MPRHKLKNAPLQEVIFELFWKLPVDSDGFPFDPGFDMALGRFQAQIRKEFPVQKRLLPESFPIRIVPSVAYQFWKDEFTWPVIQIGPGRLTVNDTEKNYSWKGNFQSNIKKAVAKLQNSYDKKIEIEKVKLMYIDAVEYDPVVESPAAFLARNMKTEIINKYSSFGKMRALNILQVFDLEQDTTLQLNIQTGIFNKTGNPAIVWTTAVERSKELNNNNLFQWLEYGHNTVSKNFIDMLNPDFYDKFDS